MSDTTPPPSPEIPQDLTPPAGSDTPPEDITQPAEVLTNPPPPPPVFQPSEITPPDITPVVPEVLPVPPPPAFIPSPPVRILEPKNWYWVVDEAPTTCYGTRESADVSTNDPALQSWIEAGFRLSYIPTYQALADYLDAVYPPAAAALRIAHPELH